MISQSADILRIEEHRQFVPTNALDHGLKGGPLKSQFLVEDQLRPCEVKSKWQENTLVSTIDVAIPRESVPRQYQETLSISSEGILAVRIQRVGSSDSRTLFYKKVNQD